MKLGFGTGQTQPPFCTGWQAAICTMSPPYLQVLLAQPEVTLAPAGMMSMTVLNSMVLKLPNNSILFFISSFLFLLLQSTAQNTILGSKIRLYYIFIRIYLGKIFAVCPRFNSPANGRPGRMNGHREFHEQMRSSYFDSGIRRGPLRVTTPEISGVVQ